MANKKKSTFENAKKELARFGKVIEEMKKDIERRGLKK